MSNMQGKKLHSTDEGASFLQRIAYNYNDRGWLARAQAPKLDVKLRYFDPLNGATPQYNGNISELEYTGTKSGTRHFKYCYDAFDRLTKADYSEGTSLDEELSYDLVGNITSLKRGAATATLYNYHGRCGKPVEECSRRRPDGELNLRCEREYADGWYQECYADV